MQSLIRTLAGLCLAGAALLVAAGVGGVGSTASANPSCAVPAFAGARGNQMDAGYYAYQAWIANDGAQAALDRVQSLLGSEFGLTEESTDADALARGLIGLALDHNAQAVNVIVDPRLVDVGTLASRAATASRDSATGRPAFRVVVKAGCNSAPELAAARTYLDGLGAGLAPNGWGFYLDASDSTFHVQIAPEDAGAAPTITSRLGDRITVEFENVALLDRLNDGQPHWGGAGIRPGALSSNNCTSAFTVILPSGNRGSVTAGHCFTGTGTINGRNVWSGTQRYGGDTAGAHDYPNYDMVRIGNGGHTWDNRIHVDPCCPSVRNVVGSGNPSVGAFICNSGMTTRAICGLEVTATNATICLSDGCRIHLIRARRGGDIVARGGDSGGPQYNRSGDNNAIARGMIVAGSGCDAQRRCTTVFGHRISAVVNHLSVTVLTR
jgi:hypothetical protein